MISKECLKTLCKLISCTEVPAKEIVENYEIIKQDLDKLAKIENIIIPKIKSFNNTIFLSDSAEAKSAIKILKELKKVLGNGWK